MKQYKNNQEKKATRASVNMRTKKNTYKFAYNSLQYMQKNMIRKTGFRKSTMKKIFCLMKTHEE